jgi:hypothetical protein
LNAELGLSSWTACALWVGGRLRGRKMEGRKTRIHIRMGTGLSWRWLFFYSFQNVFLYKTLHVSGSSSTHHQQVATVRTFFYSYVTYYKSSGD